MDFHHLQEWRDSHCSLWLGFINPRCEITLMYLEGLLWGTEGVQAATLAHCALRFMCWSICFILGFPEFKPPDFHFKLGVFHVPLLYFFFCFSVCCTAFEAITPLCVWRCWESVLKEVNQSSEMFGKALESRGEVWERSFFGRDADGSSVISRVAAFQRMLLQDTVLCSPDTSPVTNEDVFP